MILTYFWWCNCRVDYSYFHHDPYHHNCHCLWLHYLNQSLPSISLMVQSSPLKLKNFSLSFKMVGSWKMNLAKKVVSSWQPTHCRYHHASSYSQWPYEHPHDQFLTLVMMMVSLLFENKIGFIIVVFIVWKGSWFWLFTHFGAIKRLKMWPVDTSEMSWTLYSTSSACSWPPMRSGGICSSTSSACSEGSLTLSSPSSACRWPSWCSGLSLTCSSPSSTCSWSP